MNPPPGVNYEAANKAEGNQELDPNQ